MSAKRIIEPHQPDESHLSSSENKGIQRIRVEPMKTTGQVENEMRDAEKGSDE